MVVEGLLAMVAFVQIQWRQRNESGSYVGKGFLDRDNIMDLFLSAGYTQDA